MPVPALKSGSCHHITAHLLCSRPGAVSVEARLGSDAQASQRSPTHAADMSARVRFRLIFSGMLALMWAFVVQDLTPHVRLCPQHCVIGMSPPHSEQQKAIDFVVCTGLMML